MSLEVLPNEILLDLFKYFNGIELLCTFYGLKLRFNYLLHKRFEKCSIKFNSVSKRDFDMICQQHLPLMADSIVALHLSDSEETPTQIRKFLLYSSSFNYFLNLQSLSIFNLRSYSTLIKIIKECHNIDNLADLNFVYCYFEDNQADFQLIVDQIWTLPKLISCKFGVGIENQCLFVVPTKVSSTLKSLSIDKTQLKLSQIDQLIASTPYLKCLSISVPSFIDDHYLPCLLPNLIDLNIHSVFECNAAKIDTLLKNTPNLRRLSIDLSSELVNGDQWEQIIRTYVPNLEVFKLKMKAILSLGQNLEQRVDDLVNSFKSSYWVDEHNIFFRCLSWNRTVYLYTIPNQYEETLPASFKSTFVLDREQDFYNSVTRIISPTFFDQSILSNISLSRLTSLCINLPINDQLWSMAPTLNRLKSLKILFHNNIFQSQVQALLNRAPRLIALSISQYESIPLQTSLFKYINSSIFELDLRNINHYFNEEDCIKLSRSPLGIQCQKLSILVHDCESIVLLVENMRRLRALNVLCRNEKSIKSMSFVEKTDVPYYDDIEENHDDCILWLKTHLSSTCVIVRDPKLTCNILIWI